MAHFDPLLYISEAKEKHVNLGFTNAEYKTLKGIASKHGTSPAGICYIALSEWIMRNDAARRAANEAGTV